MATHSIILAWRVPWTSEAWGLQSMGSQRVGHNWACHKSWVILKRHFERLKHSVLHILLRFFKMMVSKKLFRENKYYLCITMLYLLTLNNLDDYIYLSKPMILQGRKQGFPHWFHLLEMVPPQYLLPLLLSTCTPTPSPAWPPRPSALSASSVAPLPSLMSSLPGEPRTCAGTLFWHAHALGEFTQAHSFNLLYVNGPPI